MTRTSRGVYRSTSSFHAPSSPSAAAATRTATSTCASSASARTSPPCRRGSGRAADAFSEPPDRRLIRAAREMSWTTLQLMILPLRRGGRKGHGEAVRAGRCEAGLVGARPLSDPEKHAKIGSGPPWLRWGVDLRDAEAWMDDDGPALALVRKRRAYGTSLVATGDPAAAVDLAVTLAPQLDVTSVTLPRASVVTAGAVFGPRPEGVDWEWMWTQEQPALVAGEDRVHRL